MPGVQYTCETELGLFVKIRSKILFELLVIRISCGILQASVSGGDALVKGFQCYEFFRGIALKNHIFLWTACVHFVYKSINQVYFRSKISNVISSIDEADVSNVQKRIS